MSTGTSTGHEDQGSVTVGTQTAAALYFAGVKNRSCRAKQLRDAGGFTVYDAANAAGITPKQARQQVERDGLESESAIDPETKRLTRFYFPPGVRIPPVGS